MPKLVEPKIINHKKTKRSEEIIMIINLFLKQRYKKALQNMSCGEYVLAIEQVDGRDLCELWKYVNHKSQFTEKSCEPGSQKFGSRTIF